MKKNLKQALVPLAVMVFGAAAAFATNAVKQSDKADEAAMIGYYYDHNQPTGKKCQPVLVDCNPFDGPICTNVTDPSIEYWASPVESGLECTLQLRKNL